MSTRNREQRPYARAGRYGLGFSSILIFAALLLTTGAAPLPSDGLFQTEPPDQPVKLIFIHHSTGENWLRDDYGGLGLALGRNNYFASDTNYGWGPDAIGDRTDIPNWTEWFASEATPRYMEALYRESGQNSSYTRQLEDPGGENQIIIFKSCFPNSALEGNPDDAPDPEGWLSVGHAKYVYNEILRYFGSRPDKLFVVITAPPLSDPTYASNARAFNRWLVHDWLQENQYTLNNVAVFDFYNVLTGPEAHFRFSNGGIEEILGSRNTLYYPSEDDHPSVEGSQKATEGFLPVLNFFYNRWQENAPQESLEQMPIATAGEEADIAPVENAPNSGSLDDFEGIPPGTTGWQANWDAEYPTQITCLQSTDSARSGASALKISFDVPAGTWSNCARYYEAPQNYDGSDGVEFYIHASHAGIPYSVVVFSGNSDSQKTYIAYQESPSDSEGGWAKVEIGWIDFRRVDWEEDAGTSFDASQPAIGFAFGLDGINESANAGTLWVDDLALIGQSQSGETEVQEESRRPALPCTGSIGLVLLSGLVVAFKKPR